MAILSGLLSLLSKKLGELLRALFGWSIAGLFGALSANKQTALSVALILSVLWPLLVVGCFLPNVAAWAVAFVPLHEWLGEDVLRVLWIVLAAVAPILVGVIAAWVAPSRKQRGSLLRTVLSGYPLTLGLCLSFLLTVFIIPVIKLISLAKRWQDEHVYVQVKEGSYTQVLDRIAAACKKAGVAVRDKPVPKVMQAPARVLKFFARSALDPIVANDPHMLYGEGVELYLYPTDLLIRGVSERTRHVRAAMVRELMQAPAYLTQDAAAQHLEDRLERTWALLGRHRDEADIGKRMQDQVTELAKEVDTVDIQFNDWVLLYTNVQRLQRAVDGELALASDQTLQAKEEVAMNKTELPTDVSTARLVKETVNDVQDLVKVELKLARDEVKKEISAVKLAGIALVATAVAATLGLAMLLVGLVLQLGPHPLTAVIAGAILLVVAGIAGVAGYSKLPKKPLEQTQERIQEDVQILKERLI